MCFASNEFRTAICFIFCKQAILVLRIFVFLSIIALSVVILFENNDNCPWWCLPSTFQDWNANLDCSKRFSASKLWISQRDVIVTGFLGEFTESCDNAVFPFLRLSWVSIMKNQNSDLRLPYSVAKYSKLHFRFNFFFSIRIWNSRILANYSCPSNWCVFILLFY